MSSLALIADAHTLANQQLERIRVLALLLPNERENLPSCQQKEIDAWIFEMADRAQDCIRAASDAMANLKEGAK